MLKLNKTAFGCSNLLKKYKTSTIKSGFVNRLDKRVVRQAASLTSPDETQREHKLRYTTPWLHFCLLNSQRLQCTKGVSSGEEELWNWLDTLSLDYVDCDRECSQDREADRKSDSGLHSNVEPIMRVDTFLRENGKYRLEENNHTKQQLHIGKDFWWFADRSNDNLSLDTFNLVTKYQRTTFNKR